MGFADKFRIPSEKKYDAHDWSTACHLAYIAKQPKWLTQHEKYLYYVIWESKK